MLLPDNQQFNQIITRGSTFLLALPHAPSDDMVVSALALTRFLVSHGKRADIVVPQFSIPKKLKFLSGIDHIKTELPSAQKFIIKVDVSKTKLDTLTYDIKDDWLYIYLTPKDGVFTKNELRTAQTGFRYDAIITLGIPHLEHLGDLFFNNTDLFYRTPVANIDHHTGNQHFGQANMVDLTATSLAEIVFSLLESTLGATIDAPMAEQLLTGMVSETRSFKTGNVTPHALATASKLMQLGADRETIIRHLYRTRSIAALKLWGEALQHLRIEPGTGLVVSTITREMFVRSGAEEHELPDIIPDLISNTPAAELILLIYEYTTNNGTTEIRAILVSESSHNALTLVERFHPHGNKKEALFALPDTPLAAAEETIVKTITEQLKK